jgi:hypothetical protein
MTPGGSAAVGLRVFQSTIVISWDVCNQPEGVPEGFMDLASRPPYCLEPVPGSKLTHTADNGGAQPSQVSTVILRRVEK